MQTCQVSAPPLNTDLGFNFQLLDGDTHILPDHSLSTGLVVPLLRTQHGLHLQASQLSSLSKLFKHLHHREQNLCLSASLLLGKQGKCIYFSLFFFFNLIFRKKKAAEKKPCRKFFYVQSWLLCFLHNRQKQAGSQRHVSGSKTQPCFLNDTSAQETLGQQPPEVCVSYFRHKRVSVRAAAFCSTNHTHTHTH